MIIYRLANSLYKDDLTGYGSFLYGGRWNSKSLYALYGAAHISLAVLEIVVNYDKNDSPVMPAYHLLEFELPDELIISLDVAALKKNWIDDPDYSCFIGDHFLAEAGHVALKVPSAVIPEEHNFLINPKHAQFRKLVIKSNRKYGFDKRLF